ncbi:DUF6458 family protein [Spirillospora sp. NPDC127200]
MGIGVSLAFIAIGAILAFALNVDVSGVNITMVGLILILVGAISMAFTLLYTRPRRRAGQVVGADPAYGDEGAPVETVVKEERIIERPVDAATGAPVERVERVVERPAAPAGGHTAQDPAVAQDPAYAQDPSIQNVTPIPPERRAPHERN